MNSLRSDFENKKFNITHGRRKPRVEIRQKENIFYKRKDFNCKRNKKRLLNLEKFIEWNKIFFLWTNWAERLKIVYNNRVMCESLRVHRIVTSVNIFLHKQSVSSCATTSYSYSILRSVSALTWINTLREEYKFIYGLTAITYWQGSSNERFHYFGVWRKWN